MNYLFTGILFLSVLQFSPAQQHPTFDSLLNILETQLDGLSEEAAEDILDNMTTAYKSLDSTQAMQYINRSMLLADEINYPLLKINALSNQGDYNYSYGNYDASEGNYQDMLELAQMHDYTTGKGDAKMGLCDLAKRRDEFRKAYQLCLECVDYYVQAGKQQKLLAVYSRLAMILQVLGDFKSSIEYSFAALKLAESLGDQSAMMKVYSDLGSAYSGQKHFSAAVDYLLKALSISTELNDRRGMAQQLANIGVNYAVQGDYEKALLYDLKSLKIKEETGLRNGHVVISMNNIADSYFYLNNLDSAFYYASAALKLARELNFKYMEPYPMITMGQVYQARGKLIESRLQFQSAKEIGFQTGDPQVIIYSTEHLARVEAEFGNFEAAYENHITYKQYSDSVFNESNTKAMIQLQAEHQFEQEKDSIQYANQQQQLIADQTIKRQTNNQYAMLAGVILLLVIVFILFRYYQSKQKANNTLQTRNKEIEQQKNELATLEKTKSRFFANISHELRTPLTLISSPLDNLIDQEGAYPPAETTQTLQLMQRNTRKLKGLVNDILDLSKMESSNIALKEEPVELKSLIQRISSNYTSMAEQLEIRYRHSIDEKLPTWVLLDPQRIEKVLNNLLFNAIKYTAAGGEVELALSRQNENLMIQVIDTGQGIAPDDLPHIFDRYFQSKQPDAPIQGGTGIGLALAYELAGRMGGDLTVESALDHGSTFKLEIPCKPAEAPDDRSPQEEGDVVETWAAAEDNLLPSPISETSSFRVLIVEDHPDMRQYVSQLLAGDYDISLAKNGKKALDKLSAEPFDLVITDVMMPEMDGYSLLEHMKSSEQFRNIPVVMLTALNFEDRKLQALAIGVDDYLTKPFSPQELKARVQNLITRYQTRKEGALEMVEEEPVEEGNIAHQANSSTVMYKSDLEWLKEVESVILQELENSDFQVADLADHFNLGKRQFQRRLKKLTGLTPIQYQFEIALQKARKLLEDQVYGNVTAVGLAAGFNNSSRFSERYELRFGKKPSDYFRDGVLD
ncbi:MAG: response regulator [Cytophagales bacterium]|nr:response regulator [Cytophagales bacterium]